MSDQKNIWTVMIFGTGQVQAIALQYKGRVNARRDRDLATSGGREMVTLVDDFGRELTLRPLDAAIVLLQDVDLAAEGNAIANVKNAVSQQLSQIRAQEEGEKNPEIKQFNTRMRFAQSGGAIRA